jgi:hypothetical protein
MVTRLRLGTTLVLLLIVNTPVRPASGRTVQTSAAQLASEAQILGLEQSMWEAEKNGTLEIVADRLSDDFVQIESAGMMDRAATLKAMSAMKGVSYNLDDVRVVRLTKDAATVALQYKQQFPGGTEEHGYAASTWAYRNGKWWNVMYVQVQKK